jgi:uncharacterized damage-inducible protein DinB
MPASTVTLPALEYGLGALRFARGLLTTMTDDIPADRVTFQPVAGNNHVLWVLGHVAYSDDVIRCTLEGGASTFPKEWAPLFKDGSEPTDDAKRYPAPAELRRVLGETRQALIKWFSSMNEAQLAKPLPKSWQAFARSQGELMSSIAAHETFHAGQLSAVRRALKLGRKLG